MTFHRNQMGVATKAKKARKRVDRLLADALTAAPVVVYQGATWTTDAPFRETEAAIHHAQRLGVLTFVLFESNGFAAAETVAFKQPRV